LRLVEEPPDLRPNAEQWEKRPGNRNAGQSFRLTAAGEADVTGGIELIEARDTVERPTLLPELDEVRDLDRLRREVLRRAVGDLDQSVCVLGRTPAHPAPLTEDE